MRYGSYKRGCKAVCFSRSNSVTDFSGLVVDKDIKIYSVAKA